MKQERYLTVRYGFSVALVFGLLELLKAVRAWRYMGGTPREWAGLGAAVIAYTIFLIVFVSLIRLIWRFVLRKTAWQEAATVLITLAGGMLIWALLLWHRPDPVAPDDLILFAAFPALAVNYLVLRHYFRMRAAAIAALWMVALAQAGIAAAAWAQASYLDDDRARMALIGAGGWLLAAGLIAKGCWFLTIRARRRMLIRAGCAILLTALSWTLFPLAQWWRRPADLPQAGPSVVLLSIDTLRADFCSLYGGDVPTPAMERIAARGMNFTDCRVVAPWTLPSVFSMLESDWYPAIEGDYYVYRPRGKTLAELLSEKGYVTGAYIANWIIGNKEGVMRGFEEKAAFNNYEKVRYGTAFDLSPLLRDVLFYWYPAAFPEHPADTSRRLTELGRAFLRRYGRGPFYLWLHYMDPHDPYDPPARFRDREGPWPYFSCREQGKGLKSPDTADRLSGDEKAYVRSLYKGEIAYLDECVSRILDCLDDLGIGEDTWVFLLNDHGEELWDHGRLYHGHSLYEELVRMPLLVAGPGVAPGRVSDITFDNLDMLPTIGAIAGLPPQPRWRGRSMLPLLRDGEAMDEKPVYFYGISDWQIPVHEGGIYEDGWKLVLLPDEKHYALFNLEQDPGETANVISAHPEQAARMRAAYEAWRKARKAAVPEVSASERREFEEEMRAIGYMF
jgi:arylsulfatase A-like enzyme